MLKFTFDDLSSIHKTKTKMNRAKIMNVKFVVLIIVKRERLKV